MALKIDNALGYGVLISGVYVKIEDWVYIGSTKKISMKLKYYFNEKSRQIEKDNTDVTLESQYYFDVATKVENFYSFKNDEEVYDFMYKHLKNNVPIFKDAIDC